MLAAKGGGGDVLRSKDGTHPSQRLTECERRDFNQCETGAINTRVCVAHSHRLCVQKKLLAALSFVSSEEPTGGNGSMIPNHLRSPHTPHRVVYVCTVVITAQSPPNKQSPAFLRRGTLKGSLSWRGCTSQTQTTTSRTLVPPRAWWCGVSHSLAPLCCAPTPCDCSVSQ